MKVWATCDKDSTAGSLLFLLKIGKGEQAEGFKMRRDCNKTKAQHTPTPSRPYCPFCVYVCSDKL